MIPLDNNYPVKNLNFKSSFLKLSENQQENDKILNRKFKRLLARYEKQRELQHRGLKENISDDRWNRKGRGESHNLLTYSGIKGKASNSVDTYMKNYKDRYMKKKGLSKLDCYYENKLFGKFNHMCDIAEKVHNDKKRWKKFFLKKYGISLIIFSLIPALGLIFYILFGVGDKPGIYGLCKEDHFNKPGGTITTHNDNEYDGAICPKKWLYDSKETITIFEYVNFIITFIIIAIVVFVVIYILIKVIKYEKIKGGKGKMDVQK
ncbi:hypothetical protein PVNG_00552 [Plasmodium vivax North Korean]|uniref:Variable surface protein Vir35 n=1 Tax=Plasmodium vivax North Korean TaxID=1035514 RepID=A0A0J9WCY0_PLAVI|nr:hypothetical protein PVNG_00552 [Plasmodium vivax North Korean]